MADILTAWDSASSRADWVLAPADVNPISATGNAISDAAGLTLTANVQITGSFGLYSGHDLQSAVLISLFTDAQASPDDLGGDASADPRGWWGDAGLGSKLWLRMRSKQTAATLVLVKADIQSALQWIVDDGVAAKIDVLTEWDAPGLLAAQITLHRTDGSTANLTFDWAWRTL